MIDNTPHPATVIDGRPLRLTSQKYALWLSRVGWLRYPNGEIVSSTEREVIDGIVSILGAGICVVVDSHAPELEPVLLEKEKKSRWHI